MTFTLLLSIAIAVAGAITIRAYWRHRAESRLTAEQIQRRMRAEIARDARATVGHPSRWLREAGHDAVVEHRRRIVT